MRISDWSSDVCSSDLCIAQIRKAADERPIMALVNNAAVQRLAKTSAVTMADWDESITENLSEPMRPSQALLHELPPNAGIKIGRASGRDRVGPYVYNPAVAASIKKQYLLHRPTL